MDKRQTRSATPGNGVPHDQKTAARRTVRPKGKAAPFDILQGIFGRLDAAAIHYTVARYRDDAVSIRATVPGERWEIDVLDDGTVDFERFVGDGVILELGDLNASIIRFADPPAVAGS